MQKGDSLKMNMSKMSELKAYIKNLEKFFVSPEGIIYTDDNCFLHEGLARKICTQNAWEWSGVSAEDFLIREKQYVKFSNYWGKAFRYVAVLRTASKAVLNNAYWLADVFNLRIEWYD